MKIGELSRKYNISPHTIRYYIERGMLVPKGQAQYTFSEKDEEDLRLILKMKQELFPLEGIADMLTLRRTGNLVEEDTLRQSLAVMNTHLERLHGQILQLQDAVRMTEQDRAELQSRASQLMDQAPCQTGVPFSALPLLRCPVCGQPYRLYDAVLDSRYVFQGTLRCSLGHEIRIEHGLIKTGNLYTGNHDWPDLNRGLNRELGNQYMSWLMRGQDVLAEQLKGLGLHHSVLMETHINAYFFAYNHMDVIPEDCLYIVIDRFPEMLEMYKTHLEKRGIERDILYIADDSTSYPLREACVDLLISVVSENEYSLYHTDSYLASMKPYLAPKAPVLGIFTGFHGHTKTQARIHEKYPDSCRVPYELGNHERQFREAGYRLEEKVISVVEDVKSREHYSFSGFVPGDKLHIMAYKAIPEDKKKTV